MKPIETFYKGYRFRSRLEARWAVFLDALGVKYEYEPEGFEKDGVYYLPDFRVQCYGVRGTIDPDPYDLYIEVKGKMTEEDAKKINTFSLLENKDFQDVMCGKKERDQLDVIRILIVGNIPDVEDEGDCVNASFLGSYDDFGYDTYLFNYLTVDGDYFAAYPSADSKGHFYLMGDDGNYINDEDLPRTFEAYLRAKQARFEHGEKPSTLPFN